jgi:quercetin dioxygenase-like cupin family protein
MGVEHGDGWSLATLDDLGDGPGFRKIRKELGVTAFGVNAVVMPAGYRARPHKHERQQEFYFVHEGTLEFEFEGGARHRLGPGGVVRVDADTVRRIGNVGDTDAVYVSVGGDGGYVGRDGVPLDDDDFQ